MLLVTALGLVLVIVVAAVAVVTRHASAPNDDPSLARKRHPPHQKLSLTTTDVPNINSGAFFSILVALPVLLHLYSISQALFQDPQSPLYALLRWLANF
jgi:hypothetical protein